MIQKTLVVICLCAFATGVAAQSDSRFFTGGNSDIHPKGWLETMLKRQHDGLTGHPEALSYPYNSCLWAGEISCPDESYGENWWRYEQTAYYTEGLLKLGYELNADDMVSKALEGVEYTLAHPSEQGVLGNSTLKGITWPMSVFFRVLQAKYEHDGDERIPKALEKHYLNFTPQDLAGGIVGGRNIMSIEGILWTYGKTGNKKLLQLAEEAWAIQDKFAVDETAITSNESFYMHGVTFSEMLKLPMLLYAYTGNQRYLDLATVAALYGPSTATFATDKGNVTVSCDTNYPFEETLRFHVSAADGARIPLTLRIPTWCTAAAVTVNGSAIDIPLLSGSFVQLPDAVKNGDDIVLTLPMSVERKVVEGQGVCFKRGPLLYAYAIAQQKTEDTEEHANMHGKKSENPDFKCWNITPTGDFNYAYADDGQPLSVSFPAAGQASGAFPFDINDAPVRLRIPVKQIEWQLQDNRYTPPLPKQGHLKLQDGQTKYIDLVPYGCTELRLTVFPDVDAKPQLAQNPDYTRPADAPVCVEAAEGHYTAYFELPRFCWDEPIYCKVRTQNSTTDLYNNKDGDLCEYVGVTANGRHIWRWTGPAVDQPAPVEIIFTNHDLQTSIMPFANNGYYNYERLVYKANQTVPAGINRTVNSQIEHDSCWYSITGRRYASRPSKKGIYIYQGKIRTLGTN